MLTETAIVSAVLGLIREWLWLQYWSVVCPALVKTNRPWRLLVVSTTLSASLSSRCWHVRSLAAAAAVRAGSDRLDRGSGLAWGYSGGVSQQTEGCLWCRSTAVESVTLTVVSSAVSYHVWCVVMCLTEVEFLQNDEQCAVLLLRTSKEREC